MVTGKGVAKTLATLIAGIAIGGTCSSSITISGVPTHPERVIVYPGEVTVEKGNLKQNAQAAVILNGTLYKGAVKEDPKLSEGEYQVFSCDCSFGRDSSYVQELISRLKEESPHM